MALRADGSGDYAIRTSGGFYSQTAMAVCFWLRLLTDRNASSAAFGLRNTGSGNEYIYYYNPNGDGTTFGWETDVAGIPANLDLTSLSLDAWYFLALSRSGTGANETIAYRRLSGDSALTSASGQFQGTTTINEEVVLSNGFNLSGGWFPGRIANLLQWDAALSADELLAQSYQYAPVRFANLHSWRPMIHGVVADAALDFSGNGRDLTPNGSLLIADGPPIMWGRGRRRYFLPSAAGGGTVNADARLASRSFLMGASAVARVSAARVSARSGVTAAPAVSRVAQAVMAVRSGLRAAGSLGGVVLADARLALASSMRAAALVARSGAARISVGSFFRALPLVARLGAARILARTSLRARFFQDTIPIAGKVGPVVPVTGAKVSAAPVTGAKVTVISGG